MFCYMRYNFKQDWQEYGLVDNIQDVFNIKLFQKTEDSTLIWSHFHF